MNLKLSIPKKSIINDSYEKNIMNICRYDFYFFLNKTDVYSSLQIGIVTT